MISRHMAAIFISYRRDDTISATGRLADALAARFGSEEVFRDVQAIQAGTDFRDALRDALRTAQVVLVVIGRSWNPSEYVCMEIEEAISADIPLVPVLVEGGRMPAAGDLPEPIRPFAYRQAHEVSESRWNYDTDRLIALVAGQAGLVPRALSATSQPPVADAVSRGLAAAFARLPTDFLRLVYEPRRFLMARASDAHGGAIRACVLLIVSQLVGTVLILQEWPTRAPVSFVISALLLTLLVAFVLSLPMYLAWRTAGAPRDYQRVLVILVYQCAFIDLCISLITVVMLIGFEMVVPRAVDDFAARPTIQAASVFMTRLEAAQGKIPWVIASLISGFITVGMMLWLAGSWGAYRLALGRSRMHSLAAFVIFGMLVGGPIAFLMWAALALSPQS